MSCRRLSALVYVSWGMIGVPEKEKWFKWFNLQVTVSERCLKNKDSRKMPIIKSTACLREKYEQSSNASQPRTYADMTAPATVRNRAIPGTNPGPSGIRLGRSSGKRGNGLIRSSKCTVKHCWDLNMLELVTKDHYCKITS
ncbi:hypothetical protein K435DRAFT_807287 [Dendrothele bispora CBS 962.96]|uniref:Uncharacterized protein n=1 Tax=Dendrothele bispora (strain CBS 962.96) TaxID=1314807 RepID=A0A4S8L5L1_DENBC|nr:hypothetical protein K435DRAFT_807287 [Dendrothele bispora CBS 962.96]